MSKLNLLMVLLVLFVTVAPVTYTLHIITQFQLLFTEIERITDIYDM